MQVGALGRAHGVSVEEGPEMVLSAERDSVAVSFQVCQINQVICLRHTGGQVIGPASKIVRPEDGRTFLPVILYKLLYSCG